MVQTAVLSEPAMLGGTWESLKVHKGRGLLVGTGVGLIEGAGYISIYDISQDCAHPKLLNTTTGSMPNMPDSITTHEGDFSPDGKIYWASGIAPGWISAVDVTDPANPMVVWGGLTGIEAHGMGFTPDGNTMFLSNLGGLPVLDVSAVQRRAPRTVVSQLVPHMGQKFWTDGQITSGDAAAVPPRRTPRPRVSDPRELTSSANPTNRDDPRRRPGDLIASHERGRPGWARNYDGPGRIPAFGSEDMSCQWASAR